MAASVNLSTPEKTLETFLGAAKSGDFETFKKCLDPDPVDFGFRYDPKRSMQEIADVVRGEELHLGQSLDVHDKSKFKKYKLIHSGKTEEGSDILFMKVKDGWVISDIDMSGYE